MSGTGDAPRTVPPARAVAPAPSSRAGRVFVTRALPAFALACCLLLLLPLGGDGAAAPPIRVLLLAGLVVGAVMTLTLWLALRFDLGLGGQVATYAAAFNLLVVGAKFVLGPYAVYEVNKTVPLQGMLSITDPFGAVGAGLLVFGLYAVVLWLLFAISRGRLRRRLGTTGKKPGRHLPERLHRWWPVLLLLIPVVGFGATIPVIAGVILLSPGLEYLTFVLTSGVSLVVAVTLAGAVVLAARTFRGAEQRAAALGNAAVLSSLFWVCLAFLALYQVLWVVFLLALTSVWPLKVVTPK